MDTFLCVDLESTTKENAQLIDMEAIEIGVIAVNEFGETLSTFQSFIRPRYTELTLYATAIHGITEGHLKNAESLPLVLKRLKVWLESLPSLPTAWYSWGTYDRRQLELDAGASRWDVTLPLPKHRNAKKLFQKQYLKKGQQVGLAKAIELSGNSFDGQRHRALNDARNLARIFEYYHAQ